MGIFLKHASDIEVPVGPMTLDEATLPTKECNHAVSYIPIKPNKYGIRFYMIVGSKYQYIYTIYDNGKGNKSIVPINLRYCVIFQTYVSLL